MNMTSIPPQNGNHGFGGMLLTYRPSADFGACITVRYITSCDIFIVFHYLILYVISSYNQKLDLSERLRVVELQILVQPPASESSDAG